MWEAIGFVVMAAIAIAGVYYARKSASTAPKPEPDVPTIEANGSAVDGHPGWYKIDLVARNIEPVKWRVTRAELIDPKNGKLATSLHVPDFEPLNEWDAPAQNLTAVDPETLSRRVDLHMEMAPKGTRSGAMIRGTNDSDFQSLWVFLSADATRFSIRVSLRSSAETAIDRYRMLNMNISATKQIEIV